MIIYHVVEEECYQKYTLGLAIPNFAQKNDIECRSIPLCMLNKLSFDGRKDVIFMVDAAFLRTPGTLKYIKTRLPHSKVIVFGSDSIHFTSRGKNEFDDIGLVDLFLDTMDEPVQYYRNGGLKADTWIWSFSEAILLSVLEQMEGVYIDKIFDIVCLLKIKDNEYRQNLQNVLSQTFAAYFSNGGFGGGTLKTDISKIVSLYCSSRFVLGTTSPAWTSTRTLKGFRDFLAPFCGSVLIYDDHPQVQNRWFPNGEVPFYKYDEPYSDIESIYNYYAYDEDKYQELMLYQAENFLEKSLEKQLKHIFDKHELWK